MIKILRLFGAYLQNCGSCSKYLFGKTPMHCRLCWTELLEPSKRKIQSQFWAFFLIPWSEKNNLTVRELIYSMKSGNNFLTHQFLAKEIALQILKNNHHKNSIIVPVPSEKKCTSNHAYILADQISHYLDIPLKDCLIWVDKKRSHKLSTKKERLKVKMRVNDLTLDWSKKRVLLIDDVITSGATAQAAFLAFQGPKLFCCYALSCKSIE